MKKISTKSLKYVAIISSLIFVQLAVAEKTTINTANTYPYKNLINRSDTVNIFYIKKNESSRCRVEVVLKNMKWTSVEKEVSKETFNDNILSNCLSKETAEEILHQTFLQFGQGL